MYPRIIKTAAEHAAALAHVETLMDAAPGSKAEAELELWGLLIEKFEDEAFPINQPDPVAAIEFRMDQLGLSRTDLVRHIPNRSKVSEVLGRRRPLSLSMIRSLHKGLKIPAEVLLQKPRLKRKRVAA
ncbi:MAG: type II toxin-antitoxin system HigA family antitoxin [Opitutaceae bacterium]